MIVPLAPPVRFQRKRTKGWKMPENTVYVGRPTKWGNPFLASATGSPESAVIAVKKLAVEAYENNLDPATMAAARRELRGKNLSCFCPLNHPCHADVLLKIANEETP
jgi:hypothetical protein